ncbi:Rpn family recombination-promoting nuclease/putative transposase [Lentibacillus cibarius]|nr:Rpn family recombination-promoting nuclease/putative transposase [Lentibacillus cibarius]
MTSTGLYEKRRPYPNGIVQVKENQGNYNRNGHERDRSERTRVLKRIPLEQLMDLKVDYAFKQLFGNEKNKDITVVFLNAILQKTGRNRITDISFENTEIPGEYMDDKQSRLDLLVVTEADEWINVEIQFTNKYDMVKRSLYYWSKTYTRPLEKGMAYSELRPVIAINILNFTLFHEMERFHTSYHLYDDQRQTKLTNMMEFHFIEMSKLINDWKRDQLDPWNSVLARWLLLLGMVDHRKGKVYDDIYHELEEIALTDESLRETFQNWEELSSTQEQRLKYDSRLKQIMDEEAAKREHELRMQALDKREQEMDDREQIVKVKEQEVNEKHQEMKEKQQEMIEKHQEMKEKQQEMIEKHQEMKEKQQEMIEKQQEMEEKHQEMEEKQQKIEQKAEQSAKMAIARKLLKEGMEIAFIADSTGLSRDTITDIQDEME